MIKHYSDINDYAIIRINTDKKGKELPSNLETEKKLHLSLVRT